MFIRLRQTNHRRLSRFRFINIFSSSGANCFTKIYVCGKISLVTNKFIVQVYLFAESCGKKHIAHVSKYRQSDGRNEQKF